MSNTLICVPDHLEVFVAKPSGMAIVNARVELRPVVKTAINDQNNSNSELFEVRTDKNGIAKLPLCSDPNAPNNAVAYEVVVSKAYHGPIVLKENTFAYAKAYATLDVVQRVAVPEEEASTAGTALEVIFQDYGRILMKSKPAATVEISTPAAEGVAADSAATGVPSPVTSPASTKGANESSSEQAGGEEAGEELEKQSLDRRRPNASDPNTNPLGRVLWGATRLFPKSGGNWRVEFTLVEGGTLGKRYDDIPTKALSMAHRPRDPQIRDSEVDEELLWAVAHGELALEMSNDYIFKHAQHGAFDTCVEGPNGCTARLARTINLGPDQVNGKGTPDSVFEVPRVSAVNAGVGGARFAQYLGLRGAAPKQCIVVGPESVAGVNPRLLLGLVRFARVLSSKKITDHFPSEDYPTGHLAGGRDHNFDPFFTIFTSGFQRSYDWKYHGPGRAMDFSGVLSEHIITLRDQPPISEDEKKKKSKVKSMALYDVTDPRWAVVNSDTQPYVETKDFFVKNHWGVLRKLAADWNPVTSSWDIRNNPFYEDEPEPKKQGVLRKNENFEEIKSEELKNDSLKLAVVIPEPPVSIKPRIIDRRLMFALAECPTAAQLGPTVLQDSPAHYRLAGIFFASVYYYFVLDFTSFSSFLGPRSELEERDETQIELGMKYVRSKINSGLIGLLSGSIMHPDYPLADVGSWGKTVVLQPEKEAIEGKIPEMEITTEVAYIISSPNREKHFNHIHVNFGSGSKSSKDYEAAR